MEPHLQVRSIEKKYSSIALSAAIFFGLILILADMKPLGRGLILGTLFSILNFIIMGETITKRVANSRNKAILRSGMLLLLRYVILSVPIVFAVKFPSYHLATTIAGLFAIQILIVAHHAGLAIYESNSKKLGY